MANNIKEEIKEFSKIIKKYPNINEFYLGRAKLYVKIKQYKKAIKDYKRGYSGHFLYDDIASICESKGLNEEAEQIYSKCIEENKNDIRRYLRRACFYLRIGEKGKSISDCKKILEIPSKNKVITELKEVFKLNMLHYSGK